MVEAIFNRRDSYVQIRNDDIFTRSGTVDYKCLVWPIVVLYACMRIGRMAARIDNSNKKPKYVRLSCQNRTYRRINNNNMIKVYTCADRGPDIAIIIIIIIILFYYYRSIVFRVSQRASCRATRTRLYMYMCIIHRTHLTNIQNVFQLTYNA